MGIPAGFLIAKTKKYKWMYITGYAIMTVAMFIMRGFTKDTPPGTEQRRRPRSRSQTGFPGRRDWHGRCASDGHHHP